MAKLAHGSFDGLLAKTAVRDIAWNEDAALALGLDSSFRLLGVFMLIQVDDGDIRAFAGLKNGNRPADAAIAACDECDFSLQLFRPLISRRVIHRCGLHLALESGLGMVLRGKFGRVFARARLHGLGPFLAAIGGLGLGSVNLALDFLAPLVGGVGALR
jgi:hypothetical protein